MVGEKRRIPSLKIRISICVEWHYKDLDSNQIIDSFAISSEFIFENLYARMRGDRRALTERDLILLENYAIPFPSNEQLVYDTSTDLKLKLKAIINNQHFRG